MIPSIVATVIFVVPSRDCPAACGDRGGDQHAEPALDDGRLFHLVLVCDPAAFGLSRSLGPASGGPSVRRLFVARFILCYEVLLV